MTMTGQGQREKAAGWDGLAICASALCLVHCLVLPMLIAFLPSIAEWADLGEAFHVVMLAIAVPLSGLTLWRGWRRHRAGRPIAMGSIGLALLLAGLIFEGATLSVALTVGGGVMLALAHVANLRARNLSYLTSL